MTSPVEDGVSRGAHVPVQPGDDEHPRPGAQGRLQHPPYLSAAAEVRQ